MSQVLSRSGVPIVSDFANGRGTPLVVNDDNGRAYVLVDNAVTPLGGNPYNVLDYADIEAALDAAEATGGTLYFPAGTYTYATSPNFARTGVNIVCDRGALFVHSGTGPALKIDGGTGGGLFGLAFYNLTARGNSNSTYGIYIRAVHHSILHQPKVIGCSTTGHAYQVEWCVCNEWHTPTCSVNQQPFSSTPLHGMYFTRRGVGEATTCEILMNPVMEGVSGTGIVFDYANDNQIINGTSEHNDTGLHITANSAGNVVANLDMEDNDTEDVLIEGADHTFIGLLSTNLVRFSGASASRNHLIGGRYNDITIGSGCLNNSLDNLTYSIDGGVITDSGTNTRKYSVLNLSTQLFDDEAVAWTPSVGGSATYLTQIGSYNKIGNQVTVHFDIRINNIGTGSATTISGLPFFASAFSSASVYWLTGAVTPVYVTATISVGDNVMKLYGITAAGADLALISLLGNSTRVAGTLVYSV